MRILCENDKILHIYAKSVTIVLYENTGRA